MKKKSILTIGIVSLICFLLSGIATSFALWNVSLTSTPSNFKKGEVGFTVTPQTGTVSKATSTNAIDYSVLDLATTLSSNGSFARYYKIDGFADGAASLDYTITLPTGFNSNGWFDNTNLKIAVVTSTSQCTTSVTALYTRTAKSGKWVDTSNATVTSTTRNISPTTPILDKPIKTEYLCFTGTLNATPVSGTYSNTGTVTTTEGATASSTWSTNISPLPSAETMSTPLRFTPVPKVVS